MASAMTTAAMNAEFARLYDLSLIPLRVIVPSLVWALHDYLLTLEDEVRFIWPQKRSFGRFMFFFIRYYTIMLLVFDVAQIHSFARKGVPTVGLCIAMDPTIRVIGAISLWSVEIVMQLRVYALYGRSKKVALFNGIFFMASIGLFCRILVLNSVVINGGSYRWAIWIPATVFELNLLTFALYRSISSISARTKLNNRATLVYVLLQDNILYFVGVALILILNNLMTIKQTNIPWFSFGPFHAAIGIMTTRMHIHLVKFMSVQVDGDLQTTASFAFGTPMFPHRVENHAMDFLMSDDAYTYPVLYRTRDTESVTESPTSRSAPQNTIPEKTADRAPPRS